MFCSSLLVQPYDMSLMSQLHTRVSCIPEYLVPHAHMRVASPIFHRPTRDVRSSSLQRRFASHSFADLPTCKGTCTGSTEGVVCIGLKLKAARSCHCSTALCTRTEVERRWCHLLAKSWSCTTNRWIEVKCAWLLRWLSFLALCLGTKSEHFLVGRCCATKLKRRC